MYRLTVLLLATFTLGCDGATEGKDGDDVNRDLGGFYKVKKQTENLNSCDVQGAEVQIPVPMIRIDKPSETSIEVYYCRDENDCNDFAESAWAMELLDGEWVGSEHSGYVSEQEMACAMFFDERVMTVQTDGGLKLERQSLQGYVDTQDDAACEDAYKEWLGQSASLCSNYEVIRADKVAEDVAE